jgi:hypothetical protein
LLQKGKVIGVIYRKHKMSQRETPMNATTVQGTDFPIMKALRTTETLFLGTSPTSVKIPLRNEELIEMTDPSESFVLNESQQQTVASLFAGVGSGTLSSMACAPLDLVRTRMQV